MRFTRSDFMTVLVIPTIVWLVGVLPSALLMVQADVNRAPVTWTVVLGWVVLAAVGLLRYLATRLPILFGSSLLVAAVITAVALFGFGGNSHTAQAAVTPPLRVICITFSDGHRFQLTTYNNFAADYLVNRLHVATEGACDPPAPGNV